MDDDIDVRLPVHAVVSQEYDLDASKEYIIRGNSALLKCQFPSFMADHLQVESWMIDDGTVVTHSEIYGITSHETQTNKQIYPSLYKPSHKPNPSPFKKKNKKLT
jgi:hypothetical protein